MINTILNVSYNFHNNQYLKGDIMKKFLVATSLLYATLLLADNSLGHSIGDAHLQKSNHTKSYSKHIEPVPQRVINNHHTFRKDHHSYDPRYRNFDYKHHGYYDNDGYYYGYFDTTGYFFNNIFFTYNTLYTYYDRLHRIGHFLPHRPHHRKISSS